MLVEELVKGDVLTVHALDHYGARGDVLKDAIMKSTGVYSHKDNTYIYLITDSYGDGDTESYHYSAILLVVIRKIEKHG